MSQLDVAMCPQVDLDVAPGAVHSAKVAKLVEALRAARTQGAPEGGRDIKSVVFSQWTGAPCEQRLVLDVLPRACIDMALLPQGACKAHSLLQPTTQPILTGWSQPNPKASPRVILRKPGTLALLHLTWTRLLLFLWVQCQAAGPLGLRMRACRAC